MNTREILKGFILQNKGSIFVAVSISFIYSISHILIHLLIGKYYALTFGKTEIKSSFLNFIPKSWVSNTENLLVLFFIIVLVSFVLNYLGKYLTAKIGEKLAYDLRKILFDCQLNISLKEYEQTGGGKYLLRYSGDLRSIQNLITKGIIGFSKNLALVTGTIVILYFLSPVISLILISTLVLISSVIIILNRKLYQISSVRRNRKSNLLSFVNKRLSKIETVKAFNRKIPEKNTYKQLSKKVYNTGIKFHKTSNLINALIPLLIFLVIGIIMSVIHHIKSNLNPIDDTYALVSILLLVTMAPAYRSLLKVSTIWKLGKISSEKLDNILNTRKTIKRSELLFIESKIIVKGLKIHPSSRFTLDANWNGNGIHLIEGESNTGKSTFVKLLMGLYPIENGDILFDNQSIKEVSKKSIRKHISLVSKDFPLIGKTVYQAIRYSKNATSKKKADKVLKKLNTIFAFNDPINIDDYIGNESKKLSTSEELMLMFARAILTNKNIIILDNPLNGLDVKIKCKVEKYLKDLAEQKMILLFIKNKNDTFLDYKTISSINSKNNSIIKMKNIS